MKLLHDDHHMQWMFIYGNFQMAKKIIVHYGIQEKPMSMNMVLDVLCKKKSDSFAVIGRFNCTIFSVTQLMKT